MNVVALAGGVGGAKLAHGLASIASPGELTVITNTGDDFDLYGLHICPDLDTVMYTLAEVVNPETGWGFADDTFRALEMIEGYGREGWFRLGDRDLATHVLRTEALHQGEPLSHITAAFASALGIASRIIPMTDQTVSTMVNTDGGELTFQDYFVRRDWQDVVRGCRFAGIESARPAPGVLEALAKADAIILCPSNPYLSIDPMLHLVGMRQALAANPPVVAVSPIVGGKAVKGPAAKMMTELGLDVSPVTVARHYADFLTGFVMDERDEEDAPSVEALVASVLVTDTLMQSVGDRVHLAGRVLAFAQTLLAQETEDD